MHSVYCKMGEVSRYITLIALDFPLLLTGRTPTEAVAKSANVERKSGKS